jgi:hypothetical protein
VRPPVRALAPQAPAEAVAAQEPGPEPAWFHSKHHQRPAARQRLKNASGVFENHLSFRLKTEGNQAMHRNFARFRGAVNNDSTVKTKSAHN